MEADTDDVVMLKVALVAPAGTVTLAGAVTIAVLLLVNATTAPLDGAAVFSVAVPVAPVPPVTLAGLTDSADSAGVTGADCGVKLRTLDHEPAVPAEFRPRTRHQCCRAASDEAVNCDAVTV